MMELYKVYKYPSRSSATCGNTRNEHIVAKTNEKFWIALSTTNKSAVHFSLSSGIVLYLLLIVFFYNLLVTMMGLKLHSLQIKLVKEEDLPKELET